MVCTALIRLSIVLKRAKEESSLNSSIETVGI